MPRDYDDDDRPRRRRSRDDDDDDRPRSRRRSRDDDDDDDRPAKKGSSGKTLAIILGVVGGVVLIGGVGLVFLVMFIMGKAKEGMARADDLRARTVLKDNYKAVGKGAHNYESAMQTLPLPYVRRPGEFAGQVPKDLDSRLGWRVEVLPFMRQGPLHTQFDTSGPWDSTTNQPLSGRVVPEYADHDTPADPTTRLRCFYDGGAMFDTRNSVGLMGMTDGTSNTIMFVEGGDKVAWTRFQEYKYDPKGPLPTLGRSDQSSFFAVMGDGSVKTIKKTVSEQNLRAMITRAGGEVVLDD